MPQKVTKAKQSNKANFENLIMKTSDSNLENQKPLDIYCPARYSELDLLEL